MMGTMMYEFNRKADALKAELLADPDGVRARITQQIVAERGQEWVDAHQTELDSEWAYARQVLGF